MYHNHVPWSVRQYHSNTTTSERGINVWRQFQVLELSDSFTQSNPFHHTNRTIFKYSCALSRSRGRFPSWTKIRGYMQVYIMQSMCDCVLFARRTTNSNFIYFELKYSRFPFSWLSFPFDEINTWQYPLHLEILIAREITITLMWPVASRGIIHQYDG